MTEYEPAPGITEAAPEETYKAVLHSDDDPESIVRDVRWAMYELDDVEDVTVYEEENPSVAGPLNKYHVEADAGNYTVNVAFSQYGDLLPGMTVTFEGGVEQPEEQVGDIAELLDAETYEPESPQPIPGLFDYEER